jgi:hypothetical protein
LAGATARILGHTCNPERFAASQRSPHMIRIELHVELTYEIDQNGADFVFNIHAAHTPR